MNFLKGLFTSADDKFGAARLIIGCFLASLVFHFAWTKQLMHNFHNAFFAIVDILAWIFFCLWSVVVYKNADDPVNKQRNILIITAVFLIIWAGGWAAYVNEQVK